jgi:Holliday junction resolvase-like predicted endonuclease
MSSRLTKRWTKTLKEAFGATGERGLAGELFFCDFYRKKGLKVTHFESERREQLKGIDVIIEKDNVKYTIDVKANLRDDGSFAVEHKRNGWLFSKRGVSDYISHVNPRKGIIVTYARERMQRYITEMLEEQPSWERSKNDYLYIFPEDVIRFAKWEYVKDLKMTAN